MRLCTVPARVLNDGQGDKIMRATRFLGLAVATALLLSSCAQASTPESTTTPTSPKPIDLDEMRTECVNAALREVPLEEQIRSLLVLHIAGLDRAEITSAISSTRPGGLIAMGDNIAATPAETAAVFSGLTAPVNGIALPLILGVDQEGGDVLRIPQDTFPAGVGLHGQAPAVVQQAFESRGGLVRESGLNTNFGIIADVTDNPGSFIFSRVLGVTPDSAAAAVRAAVEGEQGAVLSTLKHFPGHGATDLDSHFSLPTVPIDLETWRSREAIPFAAGIAAGAELVMLGHLVYSGVDALPASQSKQWVSVLRDELDFEGIIITDDMRMLEDSGVAEFSDVSLNAVRALQAGVSMLLFVGPSVPGELTPFVDALVAAILSAVDRGELTAATITTEAARVYQVRRNLVDADPRSWCALVAGEYAVTKTPEVFE